MTKHDLILLTTAKVYVVSPSREKDALHVMEKLKRMPKEKQILPFLMGFIYTGLGKKIGAIIAGVRPVKNQDLMRSGRKLRLKS